MDAYVISLKPDPPSLPAIRRYLPDVQRFPAVDLRGSNMWECFHEGLISRNAYDTWCRGRRWHKEIETASTVGCYQSHLSALRAGDGPVLVMEEDCMFLRDPTEEIATLLEHQDKWDVAMFGSSFWGSNAPGVKAGWLPKGWRDVSLDTVDGYGAHCVMYSAEGRKKVLERASMPQEIHYDLELHQMGFTGEISLMVQGGDNPTARPSGAASTLGHGTCIPCYLDSASLRNVIVLSVLLLLALLITLYSK